MTELPTGTVTFLFTDVEGSTRLLQRVGDAYRDLLATHDQILRKAIASGGGVEVQTEGDGFFAVFSTASGAILTAVQAQRDLASHSWPAGEVVRVRMGLHTGDGILNDGHYVGLDVHRAARIAAAGHGGQVLVSDGTRALGEPALPKGVALRDLGAHRLKDIEQPEHLHQLLIDGFPDAFPPIRSLSVRLTNLLPEQSSLVGRELEVADATLLLDQTSLLTLTGPGGIGKTRLALKIAADQMGRFADGVYMADLSPITDPRLVPAAIAAALMVREQAGRDLIESLADHLRERELLLVLDNLEQVVEAAPAVGGLIAAAPRLKVLATSRIPLHLTGEQEFAVPPLAIPEPSHAGNLERIADNDAVRLFMQRAARVRPGMRLTGDNAPIVAQIAAKLEGVPLAIELAASRAKALAPEAILARLEKRLMLLTTGAVDVPERQRTLRGTIEWSHDLLAPEHQRLFARLGAFSGGWELEAAEVICGTGLDLDVLDGLGTLTDHSMLRPAELESGMPRFTMLETIREFAVERLEYSGEGDDLRRRHAEYFRDLSEQAESHLTSKDRVMWLARLDEEHDNLRAALDWAARTGDAETGLRTAAAIWRFWLQRGHLSEGRARLERLLAMPAGDSPDRVRIRALAALGGIAYWQNDRLPTKAAYEEAMGIARQLGDAELLARALLDLSFIPFMEQRPNDAEVILKEGLAVAEEAGDPVLIADFGTGLAFLEVDRGNPAGAIEPYRQAIETYRSEGAMWRAADLLTGLGMMTRMAGDPEAAKGHLAEALILFSEAGDALSMSAALTGLALVANDNGLPERAARLIGASARMRQDAGGEPPMIGRWGDPDSHAREALGEEAYDAARAEGYAMDREMAVAYATDGQD